MSVYSQRLTRSVAVPAQSILIEQSLPAESVCENEVQEEQDQQAYIVSEEVPTQSVAYSVAPAQSVAVLAAEENCAAPATQQEAKWADYSPENVELGFPDLPEPDYKCYSAPQVPPGQTKYLAVEEPAQLKNLNQNFNDVRTAVRENNTHLQRNKTQITQVNRNHNHLLRIVTNENNFEHNLTNKIVRVADTHRQKIENVKGETRNFKDFKQTQKVEKQGCRNEAAQIVSAPAQQACAAPSAVTQAVSVAPSRPAYSVVRSAVPTSRARSVRSVRQFD